MTDPQLRPTDRPPRCHGTQWEVTAPHTRVTATAAGG